MGIIVIVSDEDYNSRIVVNDDNECLLSNKNELFRTIVENATNKKMAQNFI